MSLWILAFPLALILSLYFYIRCNDKALERIPPAALAYSPVRSSPQDVMETSKRLAKSPISIEDQIPSKTGRRYIVVGGAGFLGGWIVVHLLKRGEGAKRIRVLDIRPPIRQDLTTGAAKDVQFMKVDISDAEAVQKAFSAPWPDSATDSSGPAPEITIIHTAANIRFYERHLSLVPNSAKVNVTGTQNIIDSARSIGASSLIYTSSGSVAVRSSHFFLWPWQKEPRHFVQPINDDDTLLPKRHQDFFSNYAFTKLLAERRVRDADNTPWDSGKGVLRTGCIRPGNGVFGPGGDMLCGAYLVRKNNPGWISTVIQNFVYVENCALAHLCYEARLIDQQKGSRNPDIGGQAFCIADPGPPQTYGDVYTTLETLTDGETFFPSLSPTGMLIVSYCIEFYYLTRQLLLGAGYANVAKLLPPVDGDLVNLQPSLYNLVMSHLIFDDSRARLPPEKGGLGYKGAWTTLEGLHKTVEEHKKGATPAERSKSAGVSFGFGLVRAQRGAEKVGKKVKEEIGINPMQTWKRT